MYFNLHITKLVLTYFSIGVTETLYRAFSTHWVLRGTHCGS